MESGDCFQFRNGSRLALFLIGGSSLLLVDVLLCWFLTSLYVAIEGQDGRYWFHIGGKGKDDFQSPLAPHTRMAY